MKKGFTSLHTMNEEYEQEFIKKINSIPRKWVGNQKIILEIHKYIYWDRAVSQSAMSIRSNKWMSTIEMIMKPKRWEFTDKQIKEKEWSTEYDIVKNIYDKKARSLRFHRNIWEVWYLREIKQKYWLPIRMSVKDLLSYLRKCENN